MHLFILQITASESICFSGLMLNWQSIWTDIRIIVSPSKKFIILKKLDAPSGTAITLADGIAANHSGYKKWCFENEKTDNCIPIRSVREGLVPGTHTVSWDSDIDTITLKHEAKNRKGFALGAVVAAEFISYPKGCIYNERCNGFLISVLTSVFKAICDGKYLSKEKLKVFYRFCYLYPGCNLDRKLVVFDRAGSNL